MLAVTTSLKARGDLISRAQARADEWGLPFVERRKFGMNQIFTVAPVVLMFSHRGLEITTKNGQLRSHLSTAQIRLRSLGRGDGDPLRDGVGVRPGDVVLDCTYGLGRDAVVAAKIAGPTGEVIGLEASAALYYLAAENGPLQVDDCAPTSIEHVDARSWLRSALTDSVDVVLIDPMFGVPKTSDATFALLRDVADDAPLDHDWVIEARRVARRTVAVKSPRELEWFAEVGLRTNQNHNNARWYVTPA